MVPQRVLFYGWSNGASRALFIFLSEQWRRFLKACFCDTWFNCQYLLFCLYFFRVMGLVSLSDWGWEVLRLPFFGGNGSAKVTITLKVSCFEKGEDSHFSWNGWKWCEGGKSWTQIHGGLEPDWDSLLGEHTLPQTAPAIPLYPHPWRSIAPRAWLIGQLIKANMNTHFDRTETPKPAKSPHFTREQKIGRTEQHEQQASTEHAQPCVRQFWQFDVSTWYGWRDAKCAHFGAFCVDCGRVDYKEINNHMGEFRGILLCHYSNQWLLQNELEFMEKLDHENVINLSLCYLSLSKSFKNQTLTSRQRFNDFCHLQ